MKRKNPFVRIKQFHVTDGCDINWWVDEEEIDSTKDMFKDEITSGDVKIVEERTISGAEYNKWLIGNRYGDCEGTYMDEDCPECDCLLVKPDSLGMHFKGEISEERYCSSHFCEYENESLGNSFIAEKKAEKEWRDRPEPPKFRIEGENVFDFCKRTNIQMDRKTNMVKKDNNYWTTCTVCKKEVPVADYYISFGYAIVCFEHDGCTNKGPATLVPFTQKEKDKWGKVLFGE